MEEVRLQAFLAHAGVASRRAAEELIASGRVFVNGESVTAPGVKVRPGVDEIQVEGQKVEVQPITWIALHKPKGYVTTRDDQYGRKTVYDLLPERYHGLFHVGRLDRDSEGIILLTNDGTLANRMLHPSFGITKEYWADVEGKPTAEQMHRLTEGVDDGGDLLKAESVRRLHQTGEHEHRLSIVLMEGKNREVRRMLDAVGHPVNRLIRRRFGPVALGELKPGKWRVVTETELAGLRRQQPGKRAESAAAGGGDRPPRRATHGEYGAAPPEKKPARAAASAGKTRRNADEKGARPYAKTGARGKPARDARPGRPTPRDDDRHSGSRLGTGDSASRGPKHGRPARCDAEETPRTASRGPVRRDEDSPRRGPVRREDDSPRRAPVRRDDEAPRRGPARGGDDDAPRSAPRGGRPGAPVRRSSGADEGSARGRSTGRAGGKGRPPRRDEDSDTRRPSAAPGSGRGRPAQRDEDAEPRRPSAGRKGGQGRPSPRDEETDARRAPAGRFGGGKGRPPRRGDGEAETRRPASGARGGEQGRGRRDDDEAPQRPSGGRRTGQGDREMKAQWPQTGRPERTPDQKRDDGETPGRGGGAGGKRGGRPPAGAPRGGKGGAPGRGGGDRPRAGGKPGPRSGGGGGRGGKPRGGGRGRS